MERENEKNSKTKLPFAVFIPSKLNNNSEDFNKVFTEIISDRINNEFK